MPGRPARPAFPPSCRAFLTVDPADGIPPVVLVAEDVRAGIVFFIMPRTGRFLHRLKPAVTGIAFYN